MEETWKEREERYKREMAGAIYEYLTCEYKKSSKEEIEKDNLSFTDFVLEEVKESNNTNN